MPVKNLTRFALALLIATVPAGTLLSSRCAAQDLSQPQNQQDPPSRVARVAVAQGNVSLEPAGVETFSAAELNYPLTAGDRIYVDNASLSDLQMGGLALRLGNGADLTITSLTDAVAQFGLAQGSLRVVTRDLYAEGNRQAVVEIDTPNGTILIEQPGDIRVDSFPQDDTTVVTVDSGAVQVTAQGVNQQLGRGQALRLAGSNPVYTEFVGMLPPDGLDRFDQARERERENSAAVRNQYVDPEMVGAADLDTYGDWQPSPEYGPVWYPRSVAYGWTPYSVGHWAWVAPWGWTWVDAEPWGFAPFHYGRWNNFGGRWGWVPGPPPSVFRSREFGDRPPRPVYSPALVAFVGGANFSISIGLGREGGGGGVAAWFPLGPRETYTPWYHTSPAYVNRVNVTNIYNTNVTEVRNTYVNRTTTVYNTTNVTYVNRNVATVAVNQRDFAAGRSIAQSQPVRLDASARQQLAQAPILPHPMITPTRAIAAPQAPAKALPPTQERPVVETRQGFERAGGSFGNVGGRPGIPAPQPIAQQQQQPQPARTPIAQQQQQPQPARTPTPPPTPPQQINRGAFPQPRTPLSLGTAPINQGRPAESAPVRMPQPVQPTAPARGAPIVSAPVAMPPENRPRQPQAPVAPAAPPANVRTGPPPSPPVRMPQQNQPQPRPAEQLRPLQVINPPQARQPSFEQQRQAIQQADPGRPLGPQQVDNLRAGRPAGPASQPDKTAHPPEAKKK